jgi:hypothetical protein
VRAYRQRKADEHANVDELRVERRVLKRQLSDAIRGRARAEAALDRATTRIQRLEFELERSAARHRRAEVDLGFARSKIQKLQQHDPIALISSREPGLSREQRRAMERNKRKRGR